jgi:serine/threonine protein phosphatase PrpC
MSEDFKFTKIISVAVKDLAYVVTQENVPDPGDGYRSFVGLPSEFRRILFVLDRIARASNSRRKKLEERASMPDKAPPVQQPPPPDPMLGAKKYVPSMEFHEPIPPAKVPTTADSPDPGPAAGNLPTGAAATQPSAPPPAASLPPPSAALAPAASAPQPGGVPALPVKSVVSENIAVMPIETVKKSLYLKNARANEAYEGAVEIDGLKGLKLDDAGGSCLTFDEASGLLKGTPTASGDFVIRLQGLLHGKRAEIVANLAVIPDPKSLWVSKDSDRSDPFWKPDEAFGRTEGDLLCVAASKRGRSHAKDGTYRDDDFGMLANGPGGWHIAVVADGAGSAKFSRRGSKVAVDSVLRELPQMLEDHVTPHLPKLVPLHLQGNPNAAAQIRSQLYQSLATAAFNAAKAIEEEAAAKGEKAAAFSTTLIITVVRKVPEGWFIAGFSVGDGGAAVFDVRDGSLTTLTLPDSGEFAGQTRFLQKSEFSGGFDEVAKRIFFDVRKEFTAVALMTDGISDPKFPTDSVFDDPSKWVEFWNGDLTKVVDFSRTNAAMDKQFLEWLDFWSPGNHDDRTLAVLVP